MSKSNGKLNGKRREGPHALGAPTTVEEAAAIDTTSATIKVPGTKRRAKNGKSGKSGEGGEDGVNGEDGEDGVNGTALNATGSRARTWGGARKGAGRKSKFTAEVAERILLFVRAGNYLDTAANASGIDASTMRAWMRFGVANAETPMGIWAAQMIATQGQAEALDVAQVLRHGQKDWRALAWRLERRFPDRWRERKVVEAVGAGGGPIETMHTEIVRYEYRAPRNKLLGDE